MPIRFYPHHILTRENFSQMGFTSDTKLLYFFLFVLVSEDDNWHIEVQHKYPWRLMIWCGVVNGYLIGSYSFDGNVDRGNYLELLRQYFPGILDNANLATSSLMWFQHDAAPPHYGNVKREFLNEHHDDKSIGKGSRSEGLPDSSDMTHLFLFLWR